MQVSVQKFTRTTWPRSSAGPSGSELSHPVAPPSEGMCTRPDEAIERTHGQATNCWPPSMSYVAPVRAVLVMRWTASAATSAGPTTRPIGQRRAQLVAPGLEPVAGEVRRRQRGVDEAGGDEVDANRGELEREGRRERRQHGGGRGGEPEVATDPPAAGAAHEQQRAAGPHLAARRCARPRAPAPRGRRAPRAPDRRPSRAGARSCGPPAGDQHVVDRVRQLVEEPLQRCRVVGVEGGGAAARRRRAPPARAARDRGR